MSDQSTNEDKRDAECPYCGKGVEICHDDGYGYDEETIYAQECPHCDKEFAYTTSISFHYETYEAPCLNGGEHKWRKVNSWPNFYPGRKRCENCGVEEKGEFDQEGYEAWERELEEAKKKDGL